MFIKRILRNCLLYIRYEWDFVCIGFEILRNKTDKDSPVLLCIANPGSIGGTELQIEIIADTLKSRLGNCLVLISGKLEGGRSNLFVKRLKKLKIPVLRLRSLGLISYDQWPILAKRTAYLLSKINCKICHFFNPRSTALAPVIKTLGIAVYYMETGMPVPESSWWKILHKTMGHFNYVSSVSFEGLSRLKLHYDYKGPYCVTPSMFHLPKYSYLCRKPVQGVFDLVYFGRMTRNKGVDLLLEAFHHLLREFPYAKLFLIGSGERTSLLQNHAQELGLKKSVQFIDWLQNDELFSRLSTMDLFCLPSFSEGLPCSILEAMSIGLPVVATNVGGIPEIIEHNVSGILIPPRDVEALTKVLLELADAPLRRVQLREAALLRWKKVGTKEVIMNRLMDAYGMIS